MADLSEVKRSNFAILLNDSSTLWPIDVKLSGVMGMGKKTIPIDLREGLDLGYLSKMSPRSLGR